jgi:hypothetical protein
MSLKPFLMSYHTAFKRYGPQRSYGQVTPNRSFKADGFTAA